MTKPQFAGKLVIILAGYDNDMNNLLRVNEGLSSRFADEITFPSLTPMHCLQLLKDKLKQTSITIAQDPDIDGYILGKIEEMSKLPAWGNARDVQTLAKSMVRAVYQNTTTKAAHLLLPAGTARKCVESMLIERHARAKVVPSARPAKFGQAQSLDVRQPAPPMNPSASTASSPSTEAEEPEEAVPERKLDADTDDGRDLGVSDAVWTQLQHDIKRAAMEAEQEKQIIRDEEKAQRMAKDAEEEARKILTALLQKKAKDEAEALELLHQREQARIREMEAKAARERIQREVERLRLEEAQRRAKEERAQSQLRQMGVCPVGFKWIKQATGYRCAGGSHWVDESKLSG